jgi:hypothetical protein
MSEKKAMKRMFGPHNIFSKSIDYNSHASQRLKISLKNQMWGCELD